MNFAFDLVNFALGAVAFWAVSTFVWPRVKAMFGK